jgi:mono/diheme cytochrome c family protein
MVQPPPRLEAEEMRSIVSYIWNLRFFAASGNAARGRGVFAAKGCAGCHGSGEAPKLAAKYDALDLVQALWKHGPAMLERLKAKNAPWPRFRGEEMSDLVTFLSGQ